MKHLMVDNKWRGREATGVASFDLEEEKIYVYKAHSDVDDFFEKGLKIEHIKGATLGHNRAPTKGSPENKDNNHPMFHKHWCLIHNGTVSNENIKDYPYKGICDTEVILSLIETHGIEAALPMIKGSAALAMFNKDTFDFILYKHSNPLNLLYIPDVLFAFSSQEKALKDIPKMLDMPKLWGIFEVGNLGEFEEGKFFRYNLKSKEIEFKTIEVPK